MGQRTKTATSKSDTHLVTFAFLYNVYSYFLSLQTYGVQNGEADQAPNLF